MKDDLDQIIKLKCGDTNLDLALQDVSKSFQFIESWERYLILSVFLIILIEFIGVEILYKKYWIKL